VLSKLLLHRRRGDAADCLRRERGPRLNMGLHISPHAYDRMRDHDILPGEADAVVEDPEWSGQRPDGKQVLCRGGLAVVVRDETILTAYRLKGEAPRHAKERSLSSVSSGHEVPTEQMRALRPRRGTTLLVRP